MKVSFSRRLHDSDEHAARLRSHTEGSQVVIDSYNSKMGLKQVYRTLMGVFSQMSLRSFFDDHIPLIGYFGVGLCFGKDYAH
ncbi:hypothetical protein CASFOL_016109 [Castilleja foliolosa]|uniref:Uncharacterized protein n=1 Tax=Castilleja foliolosa TaxID=1961234 RepID=A0ABD3DJP6_9LAMI